MLLRFVSNDRVAGVWIRYSRRGVSCYFPLEFGVRIAGVGVETLNCDGSFGKVLNLLVEWFSLGF